MDSFGDIKDLFWQMCANILSNIIENPDKWIRRAFPTEGAPDWKITDNVVFLNLDQRDDDYARQVNSIYVTQMGTVIRHAMRTRVWDLNIKAYGPRAFDMVTALQDGVFTVDTQRLLTPKKVFLVPYIDRARQANEMFAGQWWERWDTTLTFNERYVPKEDVGHIEHVTLVHSTERITETQIIETGV